MIVACICLVSKENITLSITNQETTEIVLVVIKPPGNSLELYIGATIENPQPLGSNQPFNDHFIEGMVALHGIESGHFASNLIYIYHKAGTSYPKIDTTNDARPNPFFCRESKFDYIHFGGHVWVGWAVPRTARSPKTCG